MTTQMSKYKCTISIMLWTLLLDLLVNFRNIISYLDDPAEVTFSSAESSLVVSESEPESVPVSLDDDGGGGGRMGVGAYTEFITCGSGPPGKSTADLPLCTAGVAPKGDSILEKKKSN